mmetsp:Transcript_25020/g.41452  ORF Transcript_25020/g.41452 Transcript_25020/m.41452 type:complete len:99 (-) Transcript_25020:173-469(-)
MVMASSRSTICTQCSMTGRVGRKSNMRRINEKRWLQRNTRVQANLLGVDEDLCGVVLQHGTRILADVSSIYTFNTANHCIGNKHGVLETFFHPVYAQF